MRKKKKTNWGEYPNWYCFVCWLLVYKPRLGGGVAQSIPPMLSMLGCH